MFNFIVFVKSEIVEGILSSYENTFASSAQQSQLVVWLSFET